MPDFDQQNASINQSNIPKADTIGVLRWLFYLILESFASLVKQLQNIDMQDKVELKISGDERRIDLPFRQSESLSRFGRKIIFVGFAGVIISFACLYIFQSASPLLALGPIFCIIYLGICLTFHLTRSRIRWRDNTLHITEIIGLIWWSRSYGANYVGKFVYTSIESEYTLGFDNHLPRDLRNLWVESKQYDFLFPLAYWYPLSVLDEITYELVPELEWEYQPSSTSNSPPFKISIVGVDQPEDSTNQSILDGETHKIEVVEQSDDERVIKKPFGSSVKLEEHENAIVFKIPPLGFWKASGDLAKLCAFVVFLVGYMTIGSLIQIVVGKIAWWRIVYLIPWVAIAYWFWATCYRAGKAKVTIGASPDLLWIDEFSGSGKNEVREFERSDLSKIKERLVIVDSEGNQHQVKAVLSKNELSWIQFTLHQYYKHNIESDE